MIGHSHFNCVRPHSCRIPTTGAPKKGSTQPPNPTHEYLESSKYNGIDIYLRTTMPVSQLVEDRKWCERRVKRNPHFLA